MDELWCYGTCFYKVINYGAVIHGFTKILIIISNKIDFSPELANIKCSYIPKNPSDL